MIVVSDFEDVTKVVQDVRLEQMLNVNSVNDFEQSNLASCMETGQYFEKPWDDVASGIILFVTPRGETKDKTTGWGKWLEVSKLYGDHSKPFRVTANEYSPEGSEMDESILLGDHITLADALSQAITMHKRGSYDLHVLSENEEEGRYTKAKPRIRVPADGEIQP